MAFLNETGLSHLVSKLKTIIPEKNKMVNITSVNLHTTDNNENSANLAVYYKTDAPASTKYKIDVQIDCLESDGFHNFVNKSYVSTANSMTNHENYTIPLGSCKYEQIKLIQVTVKLDGSTEILDQWYQTFDIMTPITNSEMDTYIF